MKRSSFRPAKRLVSPGRAETGLPKPEEKKPQGQTEPERVQAKAAPARKTRANEEV